jgi:hypothetical protein
MAPVFRKIGLALSAAALLVTAICLPIHAHAGDEEAAPSHCEVCHFAGKAKSVTPPLPFFVQSFLDGGLSVVPSIESPVLSSRPKATASRAPPDGAS